MPGSLSGSTSMVGDIFGKSWSSTPSMTNSISNIGIGNKSPNLFGDLVGSALGQNKGTNSNAPLKNATPVSNKNVFSMGNVADSLPKTGNSVKSSGNWGSSESFGSYTSAYNSNSSVNVNVSTTASNRSPNLGGPSLKSMGGSGATGGGGMGSNKDPFGNLVDFGSKPDANINSAGKGNNKSNLGDDSFGDFKNASKPSTSSFMSNAFPTKNNSSSMDTSSKMDDFGSFASQNQPSVHSPGVDVFDSLFSSSSASGGVATKESEGLHNDQFSGGNDWGFESEFGGGNDNGRTTELEGLPPPPSGVTAPTAKNKGMDNYKQGQYPDAIKWLSWAVILLDKAGDDAGTMEVLSCRASCYKEVGEYKKAVADCTKVLEQDSTNVSVLVQRALLYESMEKYKLGAEDLRTVMKLDPGNRLARSTIHRLTKMAG
ncbi:unnamed protein product [Ilex paraguariensis]